MSNLIPNYNYYPPIQQPIVPNGAYNPNMQGYAYDALQRRAEDNAVTQATRHYKDATPEMTLATMAKSLLASFLMSVGFTSATNWLMSSKNIVDGLSNAEQFKNTRLYKIGEYLDNKIGNTKFAQGIQSATNKIGGFFSKFTKPEPIRQILEKIKMGSIAVLDKNGMYYMGQGGEALNDLVESLSNIDKEKVKALLKKGKVEGKAISEIMNTLKNFKQGTIRGPEAFKKIYPILEKLPAKELAELNKQGLFGKLIGVNNNLDQALNKARFFNASMLNKSQGPLAKLMQKITSIVGQASGNGVLGGKMSLFMGTFGLMQGFTAASNAEKGDKLKAFMEDYVGFTLGSYIMSLVVGTWFNKFLGVTEIGMNVAGQNFKDVIRKLGLDSNTKRVQDAVIAYNKEFKLARKANSIIESMNKGKIPKEKAYEQIKKLVNEKGLRINMPNSVEVLESRIKARLTTLGEVNGQIRKTMTSTLKFKGGIGKYLVQKPLELMGKILSVGRYDLIEGKKFSLKSAAKFSKRFGGGLGRALLVGFVLVEPFRKGFIKLSHAIFGKPKNSALDDEAKSENMDNLQNVMANQPAQTEQHNQIAPNVLQQPAQQMMQQPAQAMQQTYYQPQQQTPLFNSQAAVPLNNSQPIATQALSQDTVQNPMAATELRRTYIPSAQPSQFATQKDPREAEVEQALLKAEQAERTAHDFLSRGY